MTASVTTRSFDVVRSGANTAETGFCRSKARGLSKSYTVRITYENERVELLCGRQRSLAPTFHLPFLDHVHLSLSVFSPGP
jgi:hypothetical protein